MKSQFKFVVKYKDKKPQQQSIILLILATNYCNILFRQTDGERKLILRVAFERYLCNHPELRRRV